MNLTELYEGCRTYRKFRQEPVPERVLDKIMYHASIASCAGNRQALRYIIVTDETLRGKMAGLVRYAASLPEEIGTPKKDEEAMAYIVITVSSARTAADLIDLGIAADTICTSAWEDGVGTCMMLNFRQAEVNELLGIPEERTAAMVIAMGFPAHRSTITDVPADGSLKYTIDEEINYYVPKLKPEDISERR